MQNPFNTTVWKGSLRKVRTKDHWRCEGGSTPHCVTKTSIPLSTMIRSPSLKTVFPLLPISSNGQLSRRKLNSLLAMQNHPFEWYICVFFVTCYVVLSLWHVTGPFIGTSDRHKVTQCRSCIAARWWHEAELVFMDSVRSNFRDTCRTQCHGQIEKGTLL